MHFHYTDHVRSSTFLRKIQHSDYADTVTTLCSRTSILIVRILTLDSHLWLHGLTESIHLNALTRLRDIATPRVRRLDYYGWSLVQGLPPASPFSVNRVGQHNRIGPQGGDRNGQGSGPYQGDRDGNSSGSQHGVRSRDQGFQCSPAGHGQPDRSCTPRGRPVALPDRNQQPFLPNVLCAACK
jgi:hypothetical protein